MPEVETTLAPFENDLSYLEAEIAWVESRCTRIALERKRDASPEDREVRRGGFLFDDERLQPDALAKRIDAVRTKENALRESIDARLAHHRAVGPELALDALVRIHDLDLFERDTLLLAAAPCAARRFERLYAGLEAERHPGLTIDAIFSFAGLSFAERIERRATLGPRGRLVVNDLVEVCFAGRVPAARELLSTEVEMRGRVFSYLLGNPAIGDELADLVRVEPARWTFDRLVLPTADKKKILAVVERHDRFLAARAAWGLDAGPGRSRGALLLFHGPSGCGKTMAAHCVASVLGKRVLSIDLAGLLANETSSGLLPSALREAKLLDAIVVLDEAEGLLRSRRHYGNPLLAVLLPELERFDGVIVLCTNIVEMIDEAVDRRVLVKVRFAKPDAAAREAIWRTLIPPQLPLGPDVDLAALASRYEMSGGHIENSLHAAVARAVHETPEGERVEITHAMLDDAARDQSVERAVTNADLERLAHEKIEMPAARRPTGFA